MSEIENLTKKEIGIILHTSGLDESECSFRNRYVTEKDNPDLLALKEKGIVNGKECDWICTSYYFYLTKKGMDLAHKLTFGI